MKKKLLRLLKNREIKITIYAVCSILLILAISTDGQNLIRSVSEAVGVEARDSIADSHELTVHFLDVGNGDAVLVESEENNIFIDGGSMIYSEHVLTYVLRRGITRLDAVIITHPDEDHFAGLFELIKKVDISAVYTNGLEKESSQFERIFSLFEGKEREIIELSNGDRLQFADLVFEFIAPINEYDNSNDMSLVFKMIYHDFDVLFMGDAEKQSISDILDSTYDINCEVLKVSHHGSLDATSEEFLTKSSPQTAVISVGHNEYNLPAAQVLKMLDDMKIDYYRTDLVSDIIIATNANGKYSISTEGEVYEKTYN